jgi:hypothetical protein
MKHSKSLAVGPSLADLIKSQALFLCIIVGGGGTKFSVRAQKLLSTAWSQSLQGNNSKN